MPKPPVNGLHRTVQTPFTSAPSVFDRYGHTKIVKEFGAPPTAAQLGGAGPPMMGAGHMGGSLPMPGAPPNAGYAQQARPQYGAPPPHQQQAGGGQTHFSQPFGGGGGGGGMGAGGMQQQNFGQQQQSFGQAPPGGAYNAPPPPRPSNVSGPGAPTSGGMALPVPGGQARSPAGGGFAPPPPQFPPATTTVVAADSTSSAVL